MYYNAASNSMWIYLIRKVPESVRLNWELQEDPKSVFVYGKDEQPRCTVNVLIEQVYLLLFLKQALKRMNLSNLFWLTTDLQYFVDTWHVYSFSKIIVMF